MAPERRASDRPIAIACFGLVTFFPLLPLLSLPRLNSCISRSTLFWALGLYLRPRLEDFFRDEPLELLFLAVVELLRERDDLLPDELFLRAVAMRSSLLRYQTQSEVREVVLRLSEHLSVHVWKR